MCRKILNRNKLNALVNERVKNEVIVCSECKEKEKIINEINSLLEKANNIKIPVVNRDIEEINKEIEELHKKMTPVERGTGEYVSVTVEKWGWGGSDEEEEVLMEKTVTVYDPDMETVNDCLKKISELKRQRETILANRALSNIEKIKEIWQRNEVEREEIDVDEYGDITKRKTIEISIEQATLGELLAVKKEIELNIKRIETYFEFYA